MNEEKPKYIDLRSDFGFKKVFASETNKDLLIAFLNDVLGDTDRIEDVVIRKNEWLGKTEAERKAIVDLMCTDINGRQFLVEMQRIDDPFFKSRALYYTAMLINEQPRRGDISASKYALLPVHFIGILNFDLPEMGNEIIEDIFLCSTKKNKIFDEDLRFTYIALPNFTKDEDQLISALDQWLFAFKSLGGLQNKPESYTKPVFEKLFEVARYSILNKEERAVYDPQLKAITDEAHFKWVVEENTRKQREKEEAAERRNAENERRAAEAEKRNAENDRRAAEAEKRNAENDRRAAEAEKRNAENDRREAEFEQRQAEHQREEAEFQKRMEEMRLAEAAHQNKMTEMENKIAELEKTKDNLA